MKMCSVLHSGKKTIHTLASLGFEQDWVHTGEVRVGLVVCGYALRRHPFVQHAIENRNDDLTVEEDIVADYTRFNVGVRNERDAFPIRWRHLPHGNYSDCEKPNGRHQQVTGHGSGKTRISGRMILTGFPWYLIKSWSPNALKVRNDFLYKAIVLERQWLSQWIMKRNLEPK